MAPPRNLKGLRTYLAGALAAGMGFALLVIGIYNPAGAPLRALAVSLLVAGLVTMGVRGLMGAKGSN